MAKRLLLATRNPGKLEEFEDLFSELAFDWSTLNEMGYSEEAKEEGETFEQNAAAKALTYARLAGCLTLADDSGLEVDALNGHPGVRTARFGGSNLTPEERFQYLLSIMDGIPDNQRRARFYCVIAIAKPGELVGTAHGICKGAIATRPHGSGGFGYDPVFYPSNLEKTMAELTFEEKQKISHRAMAAGRIKPLLMKIVSEQESSIT